MPSASLRFDAAIDLIAPDRPGAEALCALFTLLSLSGGRLQHVSLVSTHRQGDGGGGPTPTFRLIKKYITCGSLHP